MSLQLPLLLLLHLVATALLLLQLQLPAMVSLLLSQITNYKLPAAANPLIFAV